MSTNTKQQDLTAALELLLEAFEHELLQSKPQTWEEHEDAVDVAVNEEIKEPSKYLTRYEKLAIIVDSALTAIVNGEIAIESGAELKDVVEAVSLLQDIEGVL